MNLIFLLSRRWCTKRLFLVLKLLSVGSRVPVAQLHISGLIKALTEGKVRDPGLHHHSLKNSWEVHYCHSLLEDSAPLVKSNRRLPFRVCMTAIPFCILNIKAVINLHLKPNLLILSTFLLKHYCSQITDRF